MTHSLLYHFVIIVLVKSYRFLKESLLIHHRYYDFIFTGFFLHLLVKFLLYICFNLNLDGNFNIILLLLSIYLSTIMDIYYYIHYIIDKIIKYCFYYFELPVAEFFEPWGTHEQEALREQSILWQKYNGINYCSYNANKERTRYYFFRLFFLIPISIRYFIIREPYFFAVLHSLVFINYLRDLNLYYLFIYLFIIQITRFIFYMSADEERFRFKIWSTGLAIVYTRMCLETSGLTHLNPDLEYDPKLMLKFTKNNMSLIMYFCFKQQLGRGTYIPPRYYIPLSWLPGEVYYFPSRTQRYFRKVVLVVDHWFCHLYDYIPEIYNDCQKFVKRNQLFWLSIFIFIIYFEYIITQIFITLLTVTTIKTPIPLNIEINFISMHEAIEMFFEIKKSENENTYEIFSYIKEIKNKINDYLCRLIIKIIKLF